MTSLQEDCDVPPTAHAGLTYSNTSKTEVGLSTLKQTSDNDIPRGIFGCD